MYKKREELKRKINLLVNFLPEYYKELKLENHCYRRIAYDMTVKDKWQNKVEAPFVEHVSISQLQTVVTALSNFIGSKYYLEYFNEESLKRRKNGK